MRPVGASGAAASRPQDCPLLEGRALSRRYGAVEALAETALSVQAGEFVAVVGPNGCGKSTLLRALAGIDVGSGAAGEVRIAGRAAGRIDAARVRAFVPQRPEIAAGFTAREVVRLGRFARGADEQAVVRAIDAVGLSSRADRPMQVLSGGERQRVAVARALAQVDGADAPVFLLDEPFAGIDPGEVARIVDAMRSIVRRGAVMLTLHDPGLARAVASRAIVMRQGRVLADGGAAHVLVPELLGAAYGHPIEESGGWLVPRLAPGR